MNVHNKGTARSSAGASRSNNLVESLSARTKELKDASSASEVTLSVNRVDAQSMGHKDEGWASHVFCGAKCVDPLSMQGKDAAWASKATCSANHVAPRGTRHKEEGWTPTVTEPAKRVASVGARDKDQGRVSTATCSANRAASAGGKGTVVAPKVTCYVSHVASPDMQTKDKGRASMVTSSTNRVASLGRRDKEEWWMSKVTLPVKRVASVAAREKDHCGVSTTTCAANRIASLGTRHHSESRASKATCSVNCVASLGTRDKNKKPASNTTCPDSRIASLGRRDKDKPLALKGTRFANRVALLRTQYKGESCMSKASCSDNHVAWLGTQDQNKKPASNTTCSADRIDSLDTRDKHEPLALKATRSANRVASVGTQGKNEGWTSNATLAGDRVASAGMQGMNEECAPKATCSTNRVTSSSTRNKDEAWASKTTCPNKHVTSLGSRDKDEECVPKETSSTNRIASLRTRTKDAAWALEPTCFANHVASLSTRYKDEASASNTTCFTDRVTSSSTRNKDEKRASKEASSANRIASPGTRYKYEASASNTTCPTNRVTSFITRNKDEVWASKTTCPSNHVTSPGSRDKDEKCVRKETSSANRVASRGMRYLGVPLASKSTCSTNRVLGAGDKGSAVASKATYPAKRVASLDTRDKDEPWPSKPTCSADHILLRDAQDSQQLAATTPTKHVSGTRDKAERGVLSSAARNNDAQIARQGPASTNQVTLHARENASSPRFSKSWETLGGTIALCYPQTPAQEPPKTHKSTKRFGFTEKQSTPQFGSADVLDLPRPGQFSPSRVRRRSSEDSVGQLSLRVAPPSRSINRAIGDKLDEAKAKNLFLPRRILREDSDKGSDVGSGVPCVVTTASPICSDIPSNRQPQGRSPNAPSPPNSTFSFGAKMPSSFDDVSATRIASRADGDVSEDSEVIRAPLRGPTQSSLSTSSDSKVPKKHSGTSRVPHSHLSPSLLLSPRKRSKVPPGPFPAPAMKRGLYSPRRIVRKGDTYDSASGVDNLTDSSSSEDGSTKLPDVHLYPHNNQLCTPAKNHLVRTLGGTTSAPFTLNSANCPRSCPPSSTHSSAHSSRALGSPYARHKVFSVRGREYVRIRYVGSGGSCKVYKVYDAIEGPDACYALKRVLAKSAEAFDMFQNEVTLLQNLRDRGNKHIIFMHDFEVDKPKLRLSILLEYGDCDFAAFAQTGLSIVEIRRYWKAMLLAVQEIHEARIVHSDLKPQNFLLVNGCLKLIDFGIAKSIPQDTTNIHRPMPVGTMSYMAPEAAAYLRGGDVTSGRSSDIWSLGMILYQLVYKKPPFDKLNPLKRLLDLCDSNVSIEYAEIPATNISGSTEEDRQALIDVLRGCLVHNARGRLSIPELLEHYFLVPPSATKQTIARQPLQPVNKFPESERKPQCDAEDQRHASMKKRKNSAKEVRPNAKCSSSG